MPLNFRCPSSLNTVAVRGRVSHSLPFYYGEGYKMCLAAVYANGTGARTGTHVSLSLLLLRGKYDDQLKWPMTFCGSRGHAFPRHPDGGRHVFVLCSKDNHRAIENEQKQVDHCDCFCGLTSEALNDCLTLTVTFNGSCFLVVQIA